MTTGWVLHPITDLQPGNHLGFLYQTQAEHRALLTPFLRHGLEHSEQVLYIGHGQPAETILDYLRKDGLEIEPYLASGQLRIVTSTETHLRRGVFDPDDMIDFWQTETERALAAGYQALRGAGELTWALQERPSSERLFEYEAKLRGFLPGTRCLIICLYDGRHTDPELLFELLSRQPAAVVSPDIYGDFYTLPPVDLEGDLPAALLRYWLEALTRRRRTEEAFEENQRRLQALFDNSLDAFLLADDEAHYVEANPAACALTGYSREELLGLTIVDITPGQNRQFTQEAWQAFIADGVRSGEFTLLRRDGTTREVEFRAVANIEPGLHLSVLRDITERKDSEMAIRYQAALVENVSDAIVATGKDFKINSWNRAAERIYGWQADEVVGKSVGEVIPADFLQTTGEVVREQLYEHGHWQGELIQQRKDGATIHILASTSQLKDSAGNLLGTVTVNHDITERKQAEAEIHQHAAQMEVLAGIAQVIGKVGLDVQAVLKAIVWHTAEIIGDASRITLLSDDEQWFYPIAVHHSNPETRALMEAAYASTPLSARQAWLAHVLKTGEPVLIPILAQVQLSQTVQPDHLPFAERVGLSSILIVPLRVDGRVIGTLDLTRDQPGRPYTLDDQVLLQGLADRAALTIQNARLFEQVQSAYERLQSLSHRLLEVQEVERRYVARELHDEVGQTLTSLKLLLDMSTRLPTKTVKSRLGEVQTLVNELMERVDELSLDLRPVMLDDLGLLPTLLGHFERYTRQTNIRVVFKQMGLEGRRFASNLETTVYRLTQEALTNVARHAGVDEVTVRVWVGLDMLGLEIEDLGAGFDPLAMGGSAGVSGMRERVVLAGGQLTIESSPGDGTSITVELPLSHPSERSEEG